MKLLNILESYFKAKPLNNQTRQLEEKLKSKDKMITKLRQRLVDLEVANRDYQTTIRRLAEHEGIFKFKRDRD